MSKREREKKEKGRGIKRISRNSFQLSTRSRKSKKITKKKWGKSGTLKP